ncbi:unnamed protein product [Menidia menidia]|uniref:Cytochrome b5 domain-containing protein 1 n=1 Tax=Menidia menidia TaxID=238744 RepID=A0A8S4BGE2_9TELE|nr:unnamed protein product [Menidia menidia]
MQRHRFFTPEEVAAHNTAADCWVSFLGKVCDLSPLMVRHEGEVGRLSAKTRWVRILNTLTGQQTPLQVGQVCSEETLEEIRGRYLPYNGHAHSYTWKHGGAPLNMAATLSQNSVPDQEGELDQLRLDRDLEVPAILLHFNDDLTEG